MPDPAVVAAGGEEEPPPPSGPTMTAYNRIMGTCKGRLTRLENQLKLHVSKDTPAELLPYLETFMPAMKEAKEKYAAKMDELALRDDFTAEEYTTKENDYQQALEAADDALVVARTHLRDLQGKEALARDKTHVSEFADSLKTSSAKLPTLTIRKFSGENLDFLRFSTQFISFIHEKPNLSPAEKLNYLSTVVEGDVKKKVEGFISAGVPYEAAWEKLNKRYGNKRLTVHSVMAELVKRQPAHNDGELASLKDFIEDRWTFLEHVCVDFKAPGANLILLALFESKLPADLRFEWEQKTLDEEERRGVSTDRLTLVYDLKAFFKYLDHYILSLEASGRHGGGKKKKKEESAKHETTSLAAANVTKQPEEKKGGQKKAKSADKPASKSSGASGSTGGNQGKKDPTGKCLFCESTQHTTPKCNKVGEISVGDRWDLVRTKACFRCLLPRNMNNHPTTDCNLQPVRCPVEGCDRFHHELLHKDRKQQD